MIFAIRVEKTYAKTEESHKNTYLVEAFNLASAMEKLDNYYNNAGLDLDEESDEVPEIKIEPSPLAKENGEATSEQIADLDCEWLDI